MELSHMDLVTIWAALSTHANHPDWQHPETKARTVEIRDRFQEALVKIEEG
jgi:hypothetical protein